MTSDGEIHRLSVLLFTDIVGSVKLQEHLGTHDYAGLLRRHDELFREALRQSSGRILKHTGDGFLAEFAMSSEAVATALRFQSLLEDEEWDPEPVRARAGLHQGEVLVVEGSEGDAAPQAVGMAVNLAARVMDLAAGGQILITRAVYENARYYLRDHLDRVAHPEALLRWVSHGSYEFQGRDEPMDILEVGFAGSGPFIPPEGGLKGRRAQVPPPPDPEIDFKSVDDSDVFISYASVDNQPLAEGEAGWVTRLHDTLSIRLSQLLGRPPRLWLEPKAVQRDAWHETLGDRLGSVRTLVPVISPPYSHTEACQRELLAFGENRSSGRGLIQVVKTPPEPDSFTPEAQQLLTASSRIEFFEVDPQGRFESFDASLGEASRRRFLHSVYDLAYEISHNVKRAATPDEELVDQKAVYLAETTRDLREARDRIKRELQERGYRVLPERPLPHLADELRAQVERDLEESDAVVHLIGQRYGIVPEESDRSMVEMQCALSNAPSKSDRPRGRFFWAPPKLDIKDERQASFFTALEEGVYGMDQTEFIRGSIEELKRLTLAHLQEEHKPEKALPEAAEGAAKMLYLICDPKDQEAIEPLEDHFFDLGYEVKVSPDDGDAKLRGEIHRQTLTLCDGVLIYFGQASHQWVEMTLMDIMKAPAYGRKRPLDVQAVYIASPFNRRKERFRTRAALVIREEDDAFSPPTLSSFIDQLGAALPQSHA